MQIFVGNNLTRVSGRQDDCFKHIYWRMWLYWQTLMDMVHGAWLSTSLFPVLPVQYWELRYLKQRQMVPASCRLESSSVNSMQLRELYKGETLRYSMSRLETHLNQGKYWKGKMVAYAMKRVAAGAHLPTLWLFELTKRPDDRADYCLES